MSAKVHLCDGDCGNIYYEIDLYSTCYEQMLCKECMYTFLSEQEDGSVRDAITGEEQYEYSCINYYISVYCSDSHFSICVAIGEDNGL